MNAIFQVVTRRADVQPLDTEDMPAMVKMGGICLWARSQEVLTNGVHQLEEAISHVSRSHLTITRQVLRKLLKDRLNGHDVEDRLFSAVLGSLLRHGRMESIICGSSSDLEFRVLVHIDNIPRWIDAVQIARRMLEVSNTIVVRDLERRVFTQRVYNSWSSAQHVLAYLSFRGVLVYVDGHTFQLVAPLPKCG